jgi:hypothetical protein
VFNNNDRIERFEGSNLGLVFYTKEHKALKFDDLLKK